MFSTIFILLVISFYLGYNRSKRIQWKGDAICFQYLRKEVLLSKVCSVVIMLIALLLLVFQLGIGSALFGFIVGLMGVGCLIVVLAPFRYVGWKHIAVMYVLLFLVETLIF